MDCKRCRIAIVCLLLLAASLLSATAMAEQGKITIDLWTLGTAYEEMFEKLMPAFEAEFPDVELRVSSRMSSPNKLVVAFAGNAAPDIVTQSTRNAPSFIANGLFLPVNPRAVGVTSLAEFEDLYFPGAHGSLFLYGKPYFLPTEVTTFATFVNRSILQDAGVSEVPSTWEGLRDYGQKLSRVNPVDGTFTQSGVSIERHRLWNMFHIVSMIRQLGSDWVSGDGEPNFASQEAIKAMETYASLFQSQAAAPTASSKEFLEGRVAFHPTTNILLKSLSAEGSESVSFDYDVVPYPKLQDGTLVSPSYSWGFFVTNQAEDPDLAWRIAGFFASRQFADDWFFDQSLMIPYQGSWLHDVYRVSPKYRQFLEALAHAKVEPLHPDFNAISMKLNEAEVKIVSGEQATRQAMQSLNEQVAAIMNEPEDK